MYRDIIWFESRTNSLLRIKKSKMISYCYSASSFCHSSLYSNESTTVASSSNKYILQVKSYFIITSISVYMSSSFCKEKDIVQLRVLISVKVEDGNYNNLVLQLERGPSEEICQSNSSPGLAANAPTAVYHRKVVNWRTSKFLDWKCRHVGGNYQTRTPNNCIRACVLVEWYRFEKGFLSSSSTVCQILIRFLLKADGKSWKTINFIEPW